MSMGGRGGGSGMKRSLGGAGGGSQELNRFEHLDSAISSRLEDEKRAIENGDYNLPDLTGSPKQVAWANDIREAWVQGALRNGMKAYKASSNDLKEQLEEGGKGTRLERQAAYNAAYTLNIRSYVSENTSAREWIDLKTIGEDATYRKWLAKNNKTTSVRAVSNKKTLDDLL